MDRNELKILRTRLEISGQDSIDIFYYLFRRNWKFSPDPRLQLGIGLDLDGACKVEKRIRDTGKNPFGGLGQPGERFLQSVFYDKPSLGVTEEEFLETARQQRQDQLTSYDGRSNYTIRIIPGCLFSGDVLEFLPNDGGQGMQAYTVFVSENTPLT